MKLHKLGSNQVQASLDNGIEILFSYNKPVAAFLPGKGYVRSEQFHSRTTSKHINRWVGGYNVTLIAQKTLDSL